MIDSYKVFLEKFQITEDDLIQFGLDNIISIDINKAREEWNRQKENILNGGTVFVRTYGNRNDTRTRAILIDFYKDIYPHLEVITDSTGNRHPTELLERLTGKKKNQDILNFQVSHVFAQTKNLYAFTAPWNIVYMPKVMDPLTGHESHGNLRNIFQFELRKKIYNQFEDLILEFNELMENNHLKSLIQMYFKNLNQKRFQKEIEKDFQRIEIML